MTDLWYNKNENTYYYTGSPYCKKCNKLIIPTAFFVIFTHTKLKKNKNRWIKKYVADGYSYCYECLDTIKDEKKSVKAVEVFKIALMKPSKGSIAVTIKPNPATFPSKDLSGTNVWSAASNNKNIKSNTTQVKINADKLKLANKDSWEGASIGLVIDDLEKDKVIEDESELNDKIRKITQG